MKNKIKIINIALLVLSAVLYAAVSMYWLNYCGQNSNCDFSDMTGLLLPLKTFALYLGLISLAFLFVEDLFFKRYLKYFFWWFVIVSLIIALQVAPEGTGIMSFTRNGAVELAGQVSLVVALLFILVPKFRSK